MTQSEGINELSSALSKAQGEMQTAIKHKINSFLNSSYADLSSVWDAARPVLSKYGLCVMQTTEMNVDGTKIILVTTLAHTSGQWMKSYLPLNPSKNDSQGIGAALTYFRRYALSAIVGVVCDDDDDGETAVGRGSTKRCPTPSKQENEVIIEKIGKNEISALNSLLQNLDEENCKLFFKWTDKNFNAKSMQDIPKIGFERCAASLNAKIKYIHDKNKEKTAVA
jgi:ERF superfamily